MATVIPTNAFVRRILPLVLAEPAVAAIAAWVAVAPQLNKPLIDLPAQRVEADGLHYAFDIEAGAKRMLVEGLDAIALTQTHWDVIEQFHEQRKSQYPWAY